MARNYQDGPVLKLYDRMSYQVRKVIPKADALVQARHGMPLQERKAMLKRARRVLELYGHAMARPYRSCRDMSFLGFARDFEMRQLPKLGQSPKHIEGCTNSRALKIASQCLRKDLGRKTERTASGSRRALAPTTTLPAFRCQRQEAQKKSRA